MVLWRISSSQGTKLSHLFPGAIRALSPGPARPPVVRVSNLTSPAVCTLRQPLDSQEVGGLDLGERKYFENSPERISKLLLYCFTFMKISHCKSKQYRIMQSEKKNNLLVYVHFSRVATVNRLMGLSNIFYLFTCVHAC